MITGDIFKCTDSSRNPFQETRIENYYYLPMIEQTKVNANVYRLKDQRELYKKDARLKKIASGIYIDLDSIKSLFDYIHLLLHRNHPSKLKFTLISSFPVGYGSLFVDEENLKGKGVPQKNQLHFKGK